MTQVIKITGTATEVFAQIEQLAEKAGQLTLGELVRLNELRESLK